MEGHDLAAILPTVIQIQALQAAENAGVAVTDGAFNNAQEYLKMVLGKEEKAKPGQKVKRATDWAMAFACGCNAGPSARGKAQVGFLANWLNCRGEIPVGRNIKFGRDELTHYYYAQALLGFGREHGHGDWNAYRQEMFDHLQSTQNEDGSWPAADGISVGAVYSTALWCTVLQLDNANHPALPRIQTIVK